MSEHFDPDWLEHYANSQFERTTLRQDLQQMIADSYTDTLDEHRFALHLSENPSVVMNPDPTFSHHQLVDEIADIYKFTTPYLRLPTQRMIGLSQADNAVGRSFFTPTVGWNSNYPNNFTANKQLGIITSVGNTDEWTSGNASYSRTTLEFLSPAMDKDYDKLTFVLNYLFSYQLEHEINVGSGTPFSEQKVHLTATVKEFTPNNVDSGRAGLPSNEFLFKYDHQLRGSSVPTTLKSSQQPKLHLKNIDIPQAKTGFYYRLIIELYVYTWMNYGRGANQATFTLVPFA